MLIVDVEYKVEGDEPSVLFLPMSSRLMERFLEALPVFNVVGVITDNEGVKKLNIKTPNDIRNLNDCIKEYNVLEKVVMEQKSELDKKLDNFF